MDDEQLSVALWRAAHCDGSYRAVEPVDDTAPAKEIVEISLLANSVQAFLWKKKKGVNRGGDK